MRILSGGRKIYLQGVMFKLEALFLVGIPVLTQIGFCGFGIGDDFSDSFEISVEAGDFLTEINQHSGSGITALTKTDEHRNFLI